MSDAYHYVDTSSSSQSVVIIAKVSIINQHHHFAGKHEVKSRKARRL
jgi:hypothetical protein